MPVEGQSIKLQAFDIRHPSFLAYYAQHRSSVTALIDDLKGRVY